MAGETLSEELLGQSPLVLPCQPSSSEQPAGSGRMHPLGTGDSASGTPGLCDGPPPDGTDHRGVQAGGEKG